MIITIKYQDGTEATVAWPYNKISSTELPYVILSAHKAPSLEPAKE